MTTKTQEQLLFEQLNVQVDGGSLLSNSVISTVNGTTANNFTAENEADKAVHLIF